MQDGHLLTVPACRSVSHSDGSPSGSEIETHKQRIARAVDSVREKRHQRQQKQQSNGKFKTKSRISSNEVRIGYGILLYETI